MVDNDSQNETFESEVEKFSNTKFISSGGNLGFAGGNNAGLPHCDGKYIFFINNDTEVPKDLLEGLVTFLEQQSDLGMVSPKIRFYTGEQLIQHAGATPMSGITIRNEGIGWLEKDKGQRDDIRETAYIHGAAMVVPKEVIDKVGPMYEDYFLYYEEYDWCERVKKVGYSIWYYGKSTVFHKESVSTGQDSPLKVYYLTRNRLLFARRNYKALPKFLALLYFTFIAMPKNVLIWCLKGRMDLSKAFFKGYWWNLTHNTRPK